jgi:hypothetical protein
MNTTVLRLLRAPLWALLAMCFLFTACDDGPAVEAPAPESATGFAIEKLTDAEVRITHDGLLPVSFLSTQTGATTSRGIVTVGDLTIHMTADLRKQSLDMDAGETALDAVQKNALAAFASQFGEALKDQQDAVPEHAQLLARMTSYWGESPAGRTLKTRTIEAASSKLNEGIQCITQGTTVAAQYDSDGAVNATTGFAYTDYVVVGSTARAGYECMGRCGPGCQPWYAIGSAWCKDCMDHDQCSNVFYASGGGSDPNCGDEYDEAADDWAWGLANGC